MTGYDRDLLWTLTRTEFRMRDQGTRIGFLWTLLHPLFIFAILYTMFTNWIGARVENYAAYLLIGVVQWNFFATATSAGLGSLRRKAPLIKNFPFPRLYAVVACIGAVLLSHLLEWALLLCVLPFLGVVPTTAWLMLPAVIVAQAALVVALGAVLAVVAVYVRDLERVWGIALYGLFFMTPVFYTADVITGPAGLLVRWNPVAALLEAARALLLGAPVGAAALPLGIFSIVACVAIAAAYPRWTRATAERL